MTAIKTRIRVAPDHSISGMAPEEAPAGDYEAVITVPGMNRPKIFRAADLPSHELPWDDSISLRREDMYGDDGR